MKKFTVEDYLKKKSLAYLMMIEDEWKWKNQQDYNDLEMFTPKCSLPKEYLDLALNIIIVAKKNKMIDLLDLEKLVDLVTIATDSYEINGNVPLTFKRSLEKEIEDVVQRIKIFVPWYKEQKINDFDIQNCKNFKLYKKIERLFDITNTIYEEVEEEVESYKDNMLYEKALL